MWNLHLVTYCIFFVILDSRISIIVHFDTIEMKRREHAQTHSQRKREEHKINHMTSMVTSFLLLFFLLLFHFWSCWFFFYYYYVTSFEEFRWHLFIFDALSYSMHDSSIDRTSSIQRWRTEEESEETYIGKTVSRIRNNTHFNIILYGRGLVRWRCKSLTAQMPSQTDELEKKETNLKKKKKRKL